MLASLVYLALGMTWTFRSLLEVVARPDYWEPVTTIDWIAVWSYSLAFILLAVAAPVLARQAGSRTAVLAIAWVVAIAALVTAIANGIEDGIGVESWSSVYVVAVLVVIVALLILASALWIAQRPRYAAVVVLWTIGFVLVTTPFGFVVLIGSAIAIDLRRRPASVDAAG